ncbi:MAG: hypothetical protein E7244_22790 [Enterocloster citroniae]|nr:hypothetical protein [Enterocloster citroniae]
MTKDASAARYMGKMENAIRKLEKLTKFQEKHCAEGRPLDDLKSMYAREVIAYGTLVGHLVR